MNKEKPTRILIFVIGICISLFVFDFIITNDTPMPNQEHFDDIKEHYGYGIGCDHIYMEACIEYKEDKNLTFDCFE